MVLVLILSALMLAWSLTFYFLSLKERSRMKSMDYGNEALGVFFTGVGILKQAVQKPDQLPLDAKGFSFTSKLDQNKRGTISNMEVVLRQSGGFSPPASFTTTLDQEQNKNTTKGFWVLKATVTGEVLAPSTKRVLGRHREVVEIILAKYQQEQNSWLDAMANQDSTYRGAIYASYETE